MKMIKMINILLIFFSIMIHKCSSAIDLDLITTHFDLVLEFLNLTIYLDNDDYKKIAMDWATERTYEETAFDSDTLGRFDYTVKVQYNQLMLFGYNYTPLQKQTEIVQNQVKHFSPFVGVGISTLPSAELDLGAFIDDSWGFAVSGRYNYKFEKMGINKFDIGLKVIKKF